MKQIGEMEEQWAELSCRRHTVARQGWVPRPARAVREAQGLLGKLSQLCFALHQAQFGAWVLSSTAPNSQGSWGLVI